MLKSMSLEWFLLIFLKQSSTISASPGELLSNQVVYYYSKCKWVTFSWVHVSLQSFRRHKYRAANAHIFNCKSSRLFNPLCEPKISNFPHSVAEKDISWLEVTVDDIMTGQILATLCHLVYYSPPLNVLFLTDILFQRSTLTILCNQVAVARGIVDVHKFY